MYLYARSFALPPLLLLPPASSLSLPVRACIGWRSSHHNAEKKISLKIYLTVQPKLGPVLPIMGFLLAPRVSSNEQDRGYTLTSLLGIIVFLSRLFRYNVLAKA